MTETILHSMLSKTMVKKAIADLDSSSFALTIISPSVVTTAETAANKYLRGKPESSNEKQTEFRDEAINDPLLCISCKTIVTKVLGCSLECIIVSIELFMKLSINLMSRLSVIQINIY